MENHIDRRVVLCPESEYKNLYEWSLVTKSDQDIVLGHSSGSVGEDYGGSDARLKVAERALKAALGVERKRK